MARKTKKLIQLLLGNVAVFVMLCGLLEGACYLAYIFPFHPRMLNASRAYYLNNERVHPAYLKECGRYDPEVSYRLKPGSCRFATREFDTILTVNSFGVRDDEESLTDPEIVVLGDSYAMGWGVSDDEAFPSLLEKELGVKVLNLGLPSFGTVRELRLLKAGAFKPRALVVQYADNDAGENGAFRKGTLQIMSGHDYNAHANRVSPDALAYYPGKFLYRWLPLLRDELFGARETKRRKIRTEAIRFINVFRAKTLAVGSLPVYFLEISAPGHDSGKFVSAVMRHLRHIGDWQDGPIFHPVTLLPPLTSEDYFKFDDHLLPLGHVKIARAIAQAINAEAPAPKS